MTVEAVKEKVAQLAQKNSNIHISVTLLRPKKAIEEQEAKIVGVYSNIFQIEAQGKRYTLQYSDVVTQNVRIRELTE